MITRSRTLRVALIGVTGYAAIYLRLLREYRMTGEITVDAAVVINRSRSDADAAARELESWGARVYESPEAFFNQERGCMDLCLIPAGIAWHARLSVAALRAGMNVLVEKPLASCMADVDAMRAAERETGRWIAVGYQDLYGRAAQTLRADIMAGALGAVRSVAAFGLWPRPLSYYSRNTWAGRLRADGTDVLDSPLNNAFAHFVNLGLYFTNNCWGRSADINFEEVELLRANAIESFDTAVVRASGGGVRYWFGFSHATEETREPEVLIEGTRGAMRWVYGKSVEWQENGVASRHVALPDIFSIRHEMLRAVVARFFDPTVWICDTSLAGMHTEFICKLHGIGGAESFPPNLVERRSLDFGEVGVVVPGLGSALVEAFSARCSLRETDFGATLGAPLAVV